MNTPSPVEPLNLLDSAFLPTSSRYVIGIDLGTTNCAVAYIDTESTGDKISIFALEQMVDSSTSQKIDTLPSFHYELIAGEKQGVDAKHQFVDGQHIGIVGAMARQRGMEMPGRAIASAKSWLCHSMVDRTSNLLPWGSDDEVLKVSPVEASRRYLEHIRRCWDRAFPAYPMKDQDTIVTLPASFDEVARRLTIEAAKLAGIENLILIEEPQAAFYAWLQRNASQWTEQMKPGQSILVCDIGGGTTDFTLIRVVSSSKNTDDHAAKGNSSSVSSGDASGAAAQSLASVYGLHRVAVGEHLMLGGDNLDLALAKALEQKLLDEMPGLDRLKPRQWDALKSQCRMAKEVLLGSNPPDSYTFSLPGSGSRLIESTRSWCIERSWVQTLLIDGFFGAVELSDRPSQQEEGFQEFGLPYATEPNVMKHLAAFLWDHRHDGRSADQGPMEDLQAARPDWVLFNGGVLESPQVREAIIDQLRKWFAPVTKGWSPGVLEGNRLDLAVAQGAAYFGQVRRGVGVRIDATLARAYYLLVEQNPPKALCVMPANAQPGQRFRLDQHPFTLLVGQPVQFPVLVSSTQLIDRAGQIVPVDLNAMSYMPPIQTVLELPNRKQQRTLPVTLETELSEIGTMQLQLLESNIATGSTENPVSESAATKIAWRLEFDARGTSNKPREGSRMSEASLRAIDQESIERASKAIELSFGANANVSPKDSVDRIVEVLGLPRREWSPSLLRELWRGLMDCNDYRQRSAEHEGRWLNLVGWTLRPGFGAPADDWRVNATWRSVHNKLVHRTPGNQSETIVLWRRIAGGFTIGQQRALYQDLWSRLKPSLSGGANVVGNANVTMELLRLIGSLEWLERPEKQSIVELLLGAAAKKKNEAIVPAMLWAMGRVGTRVPLYASLERVVPAEKVQSWVSRMFQLDESLMSKHANSISLCWMQWGRFTGDRYRDIDRNTRERMLDWLQKHEASESHLRVIKSGGELDTENAEAILGDALPLGFQISDR